MAVQEAITADCSVMFTTRQDGDMRAIADITKVLQSNKTAPGKHLIVPKLQHGSRRIRIDELSTNKDELLCDAVMTCNPEISLGIRVADCLPILLFDTKHRAFAVIHGGWRSLLQNIVPLTIQDMEIAYETKPQNLQVWIGPSLQGCCNRMENTNVHEKFREWQPFLTLKEGQHHLDLQGAVIAQCKNVGVLEKNIVDCKRCTYHEESDFFSYRREKRGVHEKDSHPHIAVVAWMEGI